MSKRNLALVAATMVSIIYGVTFTIAKDVMPKYIDIRQNPLTESVLEEMHQLAGSYEALFSKKAQLYKEKGLKNQNLTEADYKKYLLEHYTFLSRPVFIISNEIYIVDDGFKVTDDMLGISVRIGVEYAGKDARLPYRFFIKGNKYVSGKIK